MPKSYTITAKEEYYYHYICEHCGKQSEIKKEEVCGVTKPEDYNLQKLTPEALQAAMIKDATLMLQKNKEEAKSKMAKGRYDLKGKCAHCKKHQSWELKSAEANRFNGFWGGIAVSGFIVIAMIFMELSFTPEIIAFLFVPPFFCMILTIARLQIIKKHMSKTDARHEVVVIWKDGQIFNAPPPDDTSP